MSDDVRLQFGGLELLPELEALWLALYDHHVAIGAAGLAVVSREQSWPARRRLYEELLSKPDAFVLLAVRGETAVGYVLAHVHDGADDTWLTGERTGEIETFAVLAGERGAGLGTRMLDVAEARLAALGARTVMLHVVVGNTDAMRFYERRGMSPITVLMARLG